MASYTFDKLPEPAQLQFDRLVAAGLFKRQPEQKRILRAILSIEATDLFKQVAGERVLAAINLATRHDKYPIADLAKALHFALYRRDENADDFSGLPYGDAVDRAGDAAKRIIYALRPKLERYFKKHRHEPSEIAIPKGSLVPVVRERPAVSDTKVAVARGNGGGIANDARVHCVFLGNAEDGIRYIVSRCATKFALKTVRNTYVRLKRHHGKYLDKTLTRYINGLAKVVKRDRSRTGDPCIYEMFGGYVESQYLQDLIRIATKEKWASKLNVRWLRSNRAPIMNFIILEYANIPSEVLFGWGRHHDQWRGEVFLSNDSHVVEEFAEFFKLLRDDDVSHDLTLQELQTKQMELAEIERQLQAVATPIAKKSRS